MSEKHFDDICRRQRPFGLRRIRAIAVGIHVAQFDRHIQRAIIHIDAMVYQKRREVIFAVVDCNQQRRKFMLRLRRIHVAAGSDQHLTDFDISFASGVLQRSHAAFRTLHKSSAAGRLEFAEFKSTRTCIDIRAPLDEQLRDLGLIFGRGKQQRRISLELVGAVDVGATIDQQLHRSDTAGTRS